MYKASKENVFTKCIGTAISLGKEVLKATHSSKTIVIPIRASRTTKKSKRLMTLFVIRAKEFFLL